MSKKRRNTCGSRGERGITLVEMLIVLGILAIVASVAVPALARMGAFSNDDLGDSARSVYGMLRAARVYATTFRTETAVVYTLQRANDSRDDAEQTIVDGVGLCRKMTDGEVRHLLGASPTSDRGRRAFTLVGSQEGRFKRLLDGTCIRAAVDNITVDLDDQLLGEELNGASRQGLFLVRVYQITEQADGSLQTVRIAPRIATPKFKSNSSLADLFPAHVLKPSGEVKDEHATQVRLAVLVARSPDVPSRDRFVEYMSANPQEEVPGVRVELNKLSGRVKMTDEE